MSEPEPNRSAALRFAALVAHQLRAPVAAAASLLRTVLGGFAGPLTDRQRDLLARANSRCDQAFIWFRTCSTFANAAGRKFAEETAKFFGSTVAGHTQEIGITQPGYVELKPGEKAQWGNSAPTGDSGPGSIKTKMKTKTKLKLKG